MNINTDINILGGLPDFNLITHFLKETESNSVSPTGHHTYTSIKTDKSVKRFESAITGTLLHCDNNELVSMVHSILNAEAITPDSLMFLFWNASLNNDLLHYLNGQVFFPAFYSGRLIIKKEEVGACLKELKEREETIRGWSLMTIETVARKYLTLLKKFNLMEGGLNKKILHPYLSDKLFVLFIYWIKATEGRSNLLDSELVKYCFCEQSVFIDRVMQKKFAEYYQMIYTGDQLKIETSIPYEKIYYAIK